MSIVNIKFKQLLVLPLLLLSVLMPNLALADTITNANTVESTMVEESDAIGQIAKKHQDNENSPLPNSAFTKDVINDMLLQSMSLMGIPYRWGGNTPETGMDCSGFIRYVFKKSLGIDLPRTANQMSRLGIRVNNLDDLEPGDLLFFNIHHLNSHVGMYIGDNKFIQSPHTGDKIKITEFNDYWRNHLNGAKRIVAENKDDNGNTTIEEYQEVDDEALPSWHGNSHHGRHRHSKHSLGKKKVAKASKPSTTRSHRHKHKRRHKR